MGKAVYQEGGYRATTWTVSRSRIAQLLVLEVVVFFLGISFDL